VVGTEPQIKENYVKNGQVLLIFAPVLNHADRSDQTHQASECAADQERFWEMHDLLFENHNRLWQGDIRATVKQIAAEAGLDTAAFNACIDSQQNLERIRAQDQFRRDLGIRGQPVFSINGNYLIGAQPYETYASLIDESLAQ
jgi:protein-disulfide isomerase